MPTDKKDAVSFAMTGIPRPIWERAKAKAATYTPPISMKWLIISLLERFAPAEAKAEPAPLAAEPKAKAPPKKRLSGAARRKAAKPAEDQPQGVILPAPDLGNSF